jgi:hypothetical protein
MNKPNDTKVAQFLADLALADDEKYRIVSTLREDVLAANSKITERMMYGGIMFTAIHDFGGLFVSKNHVSFEFSDGYLFTDKENNLEGTGKKRRHLKIKKLADIKAKNTKDYIKQAINKANTTQ